MTGQKRNFANITLCAADCVHPDLAARALEKSAAHCDFGDSILFSDTAESGNFRHQPIEKLRSIDAYSEFIFKDLASYIQTDFVLIVQWDGYLINPDAWRDEFLDYDYLGARWPWQSDGKDVGNGGFSLRSKKLLDTLAAPRYRIIEDVAEDELICRLYHHWLEKEDGIRFAPGDLADSFSYERGKPERPTLGFHGLFNMWRHENDADMVEIAKTFSAGNFRSREFYELFLAYYNARKFVPLTGLYRMARVHTSSDDFNLLMKRHVTDEALVDEICTVCEKYAGGIC